jgi:hypothetical protein
MEVNMKSFRKKTGVLLGAILVYIIFNLAMILSIKNNISAFILIPLKVIYVCFIGYLSWLFYLIWKKFKATCFDVKLIEKEIFLIKVVSLTLVGFLVIFGYTYTSFSRGGVERQMLTEIYSSISILVINIFGIMLSIWFNRIRKNCKRDTYK